MLETVREFGAMQLVDAGEDPEARAARRAWAITYARRHASRLVSPQQIAAINAIDEEETNLADELRDALAGNDPGTMVELVAALGTMWVMRGMHGRLLTLTGAIADAVEGWTPPPEHADAARAALGVTLTNAMTIVEERSHRIRAALGRVGPGGDPRLDAMVRVLLAYDPARPDAYEADLTRLTEDPDRYVARLAWQWLGHLRENAGDPASAVDAAERALAFADPQDGPWPQAILETLLAQLTAQLGDRERAAHHARRAVPVMGRLGARDDEMQLRGLLVLCAIADGRLDDAEAELAVVDAIDDGSGFGSSSVRRAGRAELALARGDVATGLAQYRASAQSLRELRFPGIEPSGREPWAIFGDATALTAHAYHATGPDVAAGVTLVGECRARTLLVLGDTDPYVDIPVLGVALFGLGSWALLRDAAPPPDALALLALAERFAYNRTVPTLAWERIVPHAHERAPGGLEAARALYADRRPRDLLDEARGLVEGLGPTGAGGS
jgi:hypothetical protein